MRALLLSVLMCASTAFAEANKNSVAVFFADGTFIHLEVDSEEAAANLRVVGKEYVTAQFYIVPSLGGLPLGPNNSSFNDQISVGYQKRGASGIQKEGISFTVANFPPSGPGGALSSRFGIGPDVGDDFFFRVFNGPPETAADGMDVAFSSFDFAAPLHGFLFECITPGEDLLEIALNAQTLPAEGVYYDDNGTPSDESDDDCTQTF